MNNGNRFRTKMSFSKGELRAIFTAGVGLNLPLNLLADTGGRFSKEMFGFSGNVNFSPKLNIPEELLPKPEDFITVPFRLISAAIIAGGTWRATDFSKPGVLSASVKKLNNKPVYKEHDTSLDNWIGVVTNPKWTAAFDDASGIKVPAGIDGLMQIDAKSNPKIARGVLSGGIFSNSVTVDFDWVPSHNFSDMYEFESKLGTFDENGKMITRVAVKIHDYYESSLVWLGADPYAKMIDIDGNLLNIDITSTYEGENQAVRDSYEKSHRYSVGLSYSKDILNLSKIAPIKSNDNFNKEANMEELLKLLRVMLGLAEDAEVTPEMLASLHTEAQVNARIAEHTKGKEVVDVAEFTRLKQGAENFSKTGFATDAIFTLDQVNTFKVEAAKVEGLNAKVLEHEGTIQSLTKEKEDLQAEKEQWAKDKKTLEDTIEADKGMVESGKQFLQLRKDEAIRLYKLQAGKLATDAVVDLFEKATPEALEGLLQQYTSSVTQSFGGRCKKCGSTEFEFKSSLGIGTGTDNADNADEITEDTVSFTAIRESYKNEQKSNKTN